MKLLSEEEINHQDFYSWNNKTSSTAVVCNSCTGRLVWLGKYKRSYYQKNNPFYYSAKVGNRIRKFDEVCIKRYFNRNCSNILPYILFEESILKRKC